MVNFIEQGDIFNLNGVHSYAHGCNCAGAMGKGIALQFRERYPKMYAEYKKCVSKVSLVRGMFLIMIMGKAISITWVHRRLGEPRLRCLISDSLWIRC